MAGSQDQKDTVVLPATPVITPAGDRIFQQMTSSKPTLGDLGLVKVTVVYLEDGVHQAKTVLVQLDTLDKVVNILEDEALG